MEKTEVFEGIEEFEKNLIRLGIDHVPDESTKKKKNQNLKAEAAATMATIKENKTKNLQALKEKEARLRRQTVEQLKTKKLDSQRNASSDIHHKLAKVFYSVNSYAFAKVFKFFKKVKETDQSLMALEDIAVKANQQWAELETKRQEEITQLSLQKKKEVNSVSKFQVKHQKIQERKAKFTKHQELCKKVLEVILDIQEETEECLKLQNKIPEETWNNWMDMFRKGFSPNADEIEVPIEQPEENESFESETVKRTSDTQELLNEYLESRNKWEGSIPNDDYLGDTLEILIDTSFPPEPLPSMPEGPHYLPLKVLILGPTFSGKKTQLKKVQEVYGLKLFEMKSIVEEAHKIVQKKNEPEDKKKKPTEEEPEVFKEAALEEDFETPEGKAKLFRAKIRGVFGDEPKQEEEVKKSSKKEEVKCQGFSLVDYPKTLGEAKALEKTLSAFVHPEDLEESKASKKKREALPLAKPSVKQNPEVKLFRTFWDLVIWLDVPLETVLQRASERRIDNSGNIYSLSVNPPPEKILDKCKVIESPTSEELSEEFNQALEHKELLYRWFSEFGIKDFEKLLFFDANKPVEEVTEVILNKLEKTIEVKNACGTEKNSEPEKVTQEQAQELFSYWENIKENYYKELSKYLSLLDIQWNRISNSLFGTAENFRKFLVRDDQKSNYFRNFLSEYNSFMAHRSILTKEEENQIESSIEELLDNLWDIIDQRKEENIQYLENLSETYPMSQEIKVVVKFTRQFLLVELEKYSQVVNLLGRFEHLTQGKEFQELETPELKINWKKGLEESGTCPALEHLILTAKSKVSGTFETTNKLLEFRINQLEKWANSIISEFKQKYNLIFKTMDNWITQAVEHENSLINQAASAVKKALKSRQPLENYSFPSNELLNILENPLSNL